MQYNEAVRRAREQLARVDETRFPIETRANWALAGIGHALLAVAQAIQDQPQQVDLSTLTIETLEMLSRLDARLEALEKRAQRGGESK